MEGRRQAHLGMIQGVVNRLAQNSLLLKASSVVFVSALLALATGRDEETLVGVALLPSVAFWGLDGYFLWQERRFRALYDHVRTQNDADLDYGMDPRSLPNLTARNRWRTAFFSRTLYLFHGAIILTVGVVLWLAS